MVGRWCVVRAPSLHKVGWSEGSLSLQPVRDTPLSQPRPLVARLDSRRFWLVGRSKAAPPNPPAPTFSSFGHG